MKPSFTVLKEVLLATLAMLVCVPVGWVATASLMAPGPTERSLESEFHALLAGIGTCFLIVSFALRYALKWRVISLLLALVVSEVVLLLAINYQYYGRTIPPGLEFFSTLFDTFNLGWWAVLSAAMSIPWLLGILIGTLTPPRRGQQR